MNIEELNAGLAVVAGEEIRWADNSVMVEMADGTRIHLEYLPDRGTLYFYGFLDKLPEAEAGKLAIALLKANLFARDTGGNAVIAFDEEKGRPVIWDSVDLAAISLNDCQERFSNLYFSLMHWGKFIRKGRMVN